MSVVTNTAMPINFVSPMTDHRITSSLPLENAMTNQITSAFIAIKPVRTRCPSLAWLFTSIISLVIQTIGTHAGVTYVLNRVLNGPVIIERLVLMPIMLQTLLSSYVGFQIELWATADVTDVYIQTV